MLGEGGEAKVERRREKGEGRKAKAKVERPREKGERRRLWKDHLQI